jgi:hypothetical protein
MRRRVVSLLLVLALSVAANSALAVDSIVNPAYATPGAALPKKVVLLPPQMFVYALTAGGLPTRMTEWETAARDNLAAASTRQAQADQRFELLPMPPLSPAEADTVEAHLGLYDRVAQSIFLYARGGAAAWAHKKADFDYTLGPGLAFLREKTGADAAMIILGSDFISSGGRRATVAAGLAIGLLLPLGQAFITSGLIDLKTGAIEWMAFDSSVSVDSRSATDIDSLIKTFYTTLPGAPRE